MIIKYTLNDTNFNSLLNEFGNNLNGKIKDYIGGLFYNNKDFDEYFSYVNIINCMDLNSCLDEKQKKDLINIIKILFKKYTNKNLYLMDNFKVEIVDSFSDIYSKREYFYYITSNNVLINI